MSRTVWLADIWRMLEACAPGYQARKATHHWIVTYSGVAYRSLPKGAHGSRAGREAIEIGHVRSMVRLFGLEAACVNKHIPGTVPAGQGP